MMCIKVYVCILPGVMVSDGQDWISFKFILNMTSNKTLVEFEKDGYLPIWTGVLV